MKGTPWTPAEDAKLRDLYGTLIETAEIARRIGRPLNSVYGRAGKLGLVRPVVESPLVTAVLELASRPGGMHSTDMASGWTASAIRRCVDRGRLFPARLNGNQNVRYFTTEAEAQRALAEYRKPLPKVALRIHQAPGWGRDDPMTITPQTKYTRCPSPPAPTRSNTYAVW